MSKNLLLEIERIHNIMGIKSSLLEAYGPGPVVGEEAAERFWRYLRGTFSRGVEESTEKITEEELSEVLSNMRTVVGETISKEINDLILPQSGKILSAAEKEVKIIESLTRNKILEDAIMQKIKLNNTYQTKLLESFDKFFTRSSTKNALNKHYAKLIELNNGDVFAAQTEMRNMWESELGKERMDRYFDITEHFDENGVMKVKIKDDIQSKYPEEVEIKPHAMNSRERVIKFQDWMDNQNPTWYSNGKIRGTNGYGIYESETENAWNTYKNVFGEQLSIKDKINFVDFKGLAARDLSKFDRILLGHQPLFNKVRSVIYTFFKTAFPKSVNVEKIFDDFFSQLKSEIDNIVSIGLTNAEAGVDLSVFQANLTKLRTIKGSTDMGLLFDEIEKMLREGGLDTKELDFVMKMMKENDPWSVEYKSWLKRFIDDSTWGYYKRAIESRKKYLESVGESTKFVGAKETIRRVLNFFGTGTFKTFGGSGDLMLYFEKYGIDGYWKFYRHLQFAAKLGVPIILGICKAIFNLAKHLLGFDAKTYPEGFKGFLKDIGYNVYDEMVGAFQNWKWMHGDSTGAIVTDALVSGLIPLHVYWKDIVSGVVNTVGDIEKGFYDNIVITIWGDAIEKLQMKAKKYLISKGYTWDNSKTLEENLELGFKFVAKNMGDNFENSDIGFRLWCAKNEKTYKSYSNNIGITNDDIKWKFTKSSDGTLGTFTEIGGTTTTTTTTPTDSTTTTPTDTTTTTEPVTPEPPSTEFTVDLLLQKYPALRGNNSKITKNSDGTFSELMPNENQPDTIIIVNGKAYYQYTDSKGVQQLFPVQQK